MKSRQEGVKKISHAEIAQDAEIKLIVFPENAQHLSGIHEHLVINQSFPPVGSPFAGMTLNWG